MRFLLLTVAFQIIFACSADAFRYETVYHCSKDPENSNVLFDSAQEVDAQIWIYFGKHYSEDAVVVWHIGYQFTTFEEKHYEHLYNQTGARTSVEIVSEMGSIKQLNLDFGGILGTNVIILDQEKLTYLSKINRFDIELTEYGICKKIERADL